MTISGQAGNEDTESSGSLVTENYYQDARQDMSNGTYVQSYLFPAEDIDTYTGHSKQANTLMHLAMHPAIFPLVDSAMDLAMDPMPDPGPYAVIDSSQDPGLYPALDSSQDPAVGKEKNVRAFPFAAPAYTPELGPTLIAVMMVSFKTDPNDTLIQRSSTPVNIGASLRGSYFLNTILSTYWLEDRLRIFGEIRFRNMPDHYWGVGFVDAAANKGRDETTAYTRRYWKLSPVILWQFRKNYFVGAAIDYHRTKVTDPNPNMLSDPDYLAFGPVQFNSGLGLVARYDSRDVPVNPWKGSLVDLQHMRFSERFGGDNNFSITTLDVRHFHQILRPGSTLAMEFNMQFASGEVPYTNMCMLGSPYDLRGYFLGHYRDRSMVFALAEVRHQFRKRSGELSRHGAVGWVGTGSIAGSFGNFTNWLPNAGFGYRFEVQSRMNVRAEIGFGRESRGFYFSFNEAF